jgi:hypothetical protein
MAVFDTPTQDTGRRRRSEVATSTPVHLASKKRSRGATALTPAPIPTATTPAEMAEDVVMLDACTQEATAGQDVQDAPRTAAAGATGQAAGGNASVADNDTDATLNRPLKQQKLTPGPEAEAAVTAVATRDAKPVEVLAPPTRACRPRRAAAPGSASAPPQGAALATVRGSVRRGPPKKPAARGAKKAAAKGKGAGKAKKDRRRVPDYEREEMKEAEEERSAPKRKRGYGFSKPATPLKNEKTC